MRKTALHVTALVAIAAGIVPRGASALTGSSSCSSSQIIPGKTAVLHHPTINLIFWGSGWGSLGTTVAKLIAQTQDMISGAYYSSLTQYYGIRPPRLGAQVAWYTGTDPSKGFYETAADGKPNIDDTIVAAMTAGTVPLVSPGDTDNLYVVFVPPGVRSLDYTFGGHHGTWQVNNVWFPFAWVTDSSDYMANLSHETVEAISDPDLGGTGTYTNCPGGENEIADVCNITETQRGYNVVGYWSGKDNECVIPESYSAIYQFNANAFQSISAQAQKVFPGYLNGSPVVVATDLSDNIWMATGSPPNWGTGPIGGSGGAMFAVGNDSVYALSRDGLEVFRWNGLGTTSWTNIGLPSNAIVTGISGGAYPAATDMNGKVWTWSNSSSSWKAVAGTSNEVSQITENGVSLELLSRSYSTVWQYQGSGLTDLQLFAYSELATGGGSNTMLAAALFTNTTPTLAVRTGSSWVNPGIPSFSVPSGYPQVDTFVVGGNSLYAFSGYHQTVARANNPSVSGAGWTNLTTVPLTRLYGQTSVLIATGPVGY
jgi:hypothetical protein